MTSPRIAVRKHAFSLVETTLAIGIVSFALIALLGLFGVGYQASQGSINDTVLPRITTQILNHFTGTNIPSPGDSSTLYYSFEGVEASAQDAHYTCTVTATAPTAAVLQDADPHLVLLTIDISSPTLTQQLQASRYRP